jgi:hypothetical protein
MARYAFTRGPDDEDGARVTYDILDHGSESGRMDSILARGCDIFQARFIVTALNAYDAEVNANVHPVSVRERV